MSDHMHHAPKGRGLKLAAWVTGAYFFFEMAVGIYTGSVMVIVDAAHTFSAVGGVVLMQNTPKGIDMTEICRRLRSVDGVRDVHHPHAWTLTSGRHIFSAHLRVDDGLGSNAQMRLLEMAEELLSAEFGIYFSTLQLETEDREEPDAREIDIGAR